MFLTRCPRRSRSRSRFPIRVERDRERPAPTHPSYGRGPQPARTRRPHHESYRRGGIHSPRGRPRSNRRANPRASRSRARPTALSPARPPVLTLPASTGIPWCIAAKRLRSRSDDPRAGCRSPRHWAPTEGRSSSSAVLRSPRRCACAIRSEAPAICSAPNGSRSAGSCRLPHGCFTSGRCPSLPCPPCRPSSSQPAWYVAI